MLLLFSELSMSLLPSVLSRSSNKLFSGARRTKHMSRGEESAASSLSRNVVVAVVSHVVATSLGESNCAEENLFGELHGKDGGVERLGKAALRFDTVSGPTAP